MSSPQSRKHSLMTESIGMESFIVITMKNNKNDDDIWTKHVPVQFRTHLKSVLENDEFMKMHLIFRLNQSHFYPCLTIINKKLTTL